jgi:hypothetical protein
MRLRSDRFARQRQRSAGRNTDMKTFTAMAVGVLAAGGIALGTSAPAQAGCQGGWTPWGGGTTCDGPIGQDGGFQRCVTAGAMGFGGTNCYLLNVNNLGNQIPYVGP